MKPLILALAFCAIAAVHPAQAVETEVLFDGTDIGDWDTGRDQDRLQREFSLSELSAVKDPPALQWRFVSKGVGFNDVFLMKPIERPVAAFRVRLKNEGEAFEFAAKVRDADAAEWTTNRVQLAAGGDWQWVEFPREVWQVAPWSRDADGKLDFPLSSFTLIAFGVQPGVEYRLKVSAIEAVRPDPPVATIRELRLPATMQAGKTYPLALSFSLNKPCTEPEAYVSFKQGKAELFRVPIQLSGLMEAAAGQQITLTGGQVPVPLYAAGGKLAAVLHLGDAHVQEAGKSLDEEARAVTIQARTPGHTIAQVKLQNGTPTLFINGQPHNGMTWATYGPTPEVFSDFTKAGITLYTFAATPTESGYGLSKTAWVAPDKYDFSQLDERVMMLLQANPNAYFFPRLYVHAPKWWSDAHPDDIVLMDPGDGKYVPFIHAGGKPAPSWASETWRRDTVEGLKHLIAHVEASPYADRIIGYHIASGTTEEWMMWGGNEDEWVDYSPVNVARFRQWLTAKYASDAKLQAAWHDPNVTFATAAIPPKAQRQRTELGALRDPTKEQAVIDYYLYNSDLVAGTISYFAKAVKDITKREKIVGAFYGYLLQLCGEQRQQNAGHLALEKVLASPDIDFVCSPTSYAFRQLGGEGTSHFMSLWGSVKLHGKLWFDENDIRTSLSGGQVGEWGRPANVAGDIIQQEKELANVITNGTAQWWFDVGGNVYKDPALMARIGGLAKSATQAQSLDRSPADEVAMVIDERSLCYLRVGDPLGAWLLVSQLPDLARIGAPVGHYLVTDLPRIADRKVFLIMTSFAPTAEDRRAIEALKRDGHVLVFLWAPGIYRDGQLDEAGMADLTGIKLRMSLEPGALQVTLKPGHRLTDGLGIPAFGVADHRTLPICYADDPQATALGTLPDGKTGLAVREFGTWTSIYSSAPMLPTPLLRRIAELGGVHRYIDTPDVVWATKQLLAVCVKDAGPRKITLPRKADVSDLYTGEKVATGVDSFEADFADRATRVFVVK
jgi:hypothetical protein